MYNTSVIVFDLGNVLIPFDYTPFFSKLEAIKPGLGVNLQMLYAENYHIHRKFEAGLLTRPQFMEILNNWTEGLLEEEYFCHIFSDIFKVNNDLVALLPKLKAKYKLVILSNTNPIHKKYGWEKYDFLKYFDKLILSHEVHAVKPEEAIYKAVENFTGLPADNHIFIDDVLEYAEGAKKMGWDAINFIGNENLISEFKKRNIL